MTLTQPGAGTHCGINVTPLIDILLVLLIVFMLITPLRSKGLTAAIPEPAIPSRDEGRRPVTLDIASDGTLRIDGTLTGRTELAQGIAAAFERGQSKIVVVRADRTLEFRQVASVIDEVAGSDHAIRFAIVAATAS